MSRFPETRFSLIVKLQDTADIVSWTQFVDIYEPMIYRIARSHGLQHVDAEEVTQEVLCSVARKVVDWKPSRQPGSFRRWLYCVMRSRLVDLYRSERNRLDFSIGGSDVAELLENQPGDFDAHLESERRQAIFLWAAKRVREEVQPATWEAFWRTGVGGEEVDAVARALGMSRGGVYVAKSRVMSRLRQAVQEHLTDSEVVEGVSP